MNPKLSFEIKKKVWWMYYFLTVSSIIAISIPLLRDAPGFIERIGLNTFPLNDGWSWLLSAVIVLLYVTYTVKFVPFVGKNMFVFSWLKAISIISTIVLGIFEELWFRKILMDWLLSFEYGFIIQVLVSGLVFGVAHTLWVLNGGQLKIALPVIFSTSMLGFLLAILYIVGDRNLIFPIAAHVTINLFIEPWLIVSSVSGEMGDDKLASVSNK